MHYLAEAYSRRKPVVSRRIEFIGRIGFRRRHKWSMPFVVTAYRIKHMAGSR